MRRIIKVTKVTRMVRIADVLNDILTDVHDEDLLEKHNLTWKQLQKVYAKLFHAGYLEREDMERRIELRCGRDPSHIPFAEILHSEALYECEVCGYWSIFHFTICPRCSQINMRRLTRPMPRKRLVVSRAHYSAGA
jgi:hypothetical protein